MGTGSRFRLGPGSPGWGRAIRPSCLLVALCILLAGLPPFVPFGGGVRDAAAAEALDTALLRNVDEQITVTLSAFRYNRIARTYLGVATVTNHSGEALSAPLYLVLASISPPGTTVVGATGVTTTTAPYYSLAALLPGGVLSPGSTTNPLILQLKIPTTSAIQLEPHVYALTATANALPTANAGPDQTTRVGDTVTFDGSGSSDDDGDPLTFHWALVGAPPGSAAALSTPSIVNPSFVVDRPGDYVAELVVNDGLADSEPDLVGLSTINSPPIADAGEDLSVFVGDSVELDGSNSSDVDGDQITFFWNLLERPDTSVASLDDAMRVTPAFAVDAPGRFVAELIVSDGVEESAPDRVTITTLNSPPRADAGPDQGVRVDEIVTLDGSASVDPDGDPMTFFWALTITPDASLAALSDPQAVAPTFSADLPGTYVAQLIVSDGDLDSDPDTAMITTANSRPVADAGDDWETFVGDRLILDGSGSQDADLDPLDFTWSLVARPADSLTELENATSVHPGLPIDVHGTYVVQLIVSDGALDSAPDTARIDTINSVPVADPGPDQNVLVGEIVLLDGTDSFDPDGDPLTYAWQLSAKPSASGAVLSSHQAATTSFTADLPGTYVLELTVNDGLLDSAPETLLVTAEEPALPPLITSPPVTSATEGAAYSYDVEAEDPNPADVVTFSLVSAPGGMQIDPSTGIVDWVPSHAQVGTHQVTIRAEDGSGLFDEQTYALIVASAPIVVDAGTDRQLTEGEAFDLPPATVTVAVAGGTYSASVDWGDGTPAQSATVEMAADGYRVAATHTYPDDGQHAVTLCVTDDNGAMGCATIDVAVQNLAPSVDAGPDRTLLTGEPLTLDDARFTDAGALDVHTATIDWGDGIVESGAVDQAARSVAGEHTYLEAGGYTVRLCVEDDDGAAGCDELIASVSPPELDLTVFDIGTAQLTYETQGTGTPAPAGTGVAVSGQVTAQVANGGIDPVTVPFAVLFFADRDFDGGFDAAVDTPLGTALVAGPLAAGAAVEVAATVSGEVGFPDAPVWAFVDSGNAIAETDEDNNLDVSSASCTYVPPVGQLDPVVEWKKDSFLASPASNQVMMAPAVADLDDDGVPDIVFFTFEGSQAKANGILRAIRGDDGTELWAVDGEDYRVFPTGGVALGDIDGDGRLEIVAPHETEGLLAFEDDGSIKWHAKGFGTPSSGENRLFPALADLDQDGTPEIVAGPIALNSDGTIRWSGNPPSGEGWRGPVVADLDLDGLPEVITGRSAYRADGSPYWEAGVPDGRVAVANLDADDYPEVVLVAQGSVYLLEHDGQLNWGPVALPGGGWGGAPTVADMDGDGSPDIGVAGGSQYVVLERDGTVKWSSPVQDLSSQTTGSTVFDFEGDGAAEVIYGDEVFLRVFGGRDGSVLYQVPKRSETVAEYPVIADVDADGNAEIIGVAADYTTYSQNGIIVIGDANDTWVPTRQIWNQYSYHITNVNDDGSIPSVEQNSWQVHNTYRLNAFPDRSPYAAPDLVATYVRFDENGNQVTFTARIGNAGVVEVGPGLDVAFYDGDPGNGGVGVGVVQTTQRILPGGYEDISLVLARDVALDLWVVADDDGSGRGKVNECDELDNVHHPAVEYTNQPPTITSTPVSQQISSDIVTADGYAAIHFSTPVNQLPPTEGRSSITYPSAFTVDGRLLLVTREDDAPGSGNNVIAIAADGSDVELSAPSQFPSSGTSEEGRFGRGIVLDPSDPTSYALLADVGSICVGTTPCAYVFPGYVNGRILRLDLNTGDIEVVVDRGELIDPLAVKVDPVSGKVYVFDRGAADVIGDGRIALLEGSTLTTVLDGIDPIDMVFYPDGSYLFSNGGGSNAADQPGLYRVRNGAVEKISDQTGFLGLAPPGPFEAGLYLFTGESIIELFDDDADGVIDSTKTIVESGIAGGLTFDAAGFMYALRGTPGTAYSVLKIVPEDYLIPAVQGSPYIYDVEATDPDPGDVLTYSLDISPAGMSIDPETGLIQWVPTAYQAGTYEAAVRVEDLAGLFDQQGFSVAVNEAPIKVDAGPDSQLVEGDTFTFPPATFLPLAGVASYTANVDWGDGSPLQPADVEVTDGIGTVAASHRYLDDGQITATLCVTGDNGATGCDDVALTIENAAPVVDCAVRQGGLVSVVGSTLIQIDPASGLSTVIGETGYTDVASLATDNQGSIVYGIADSTSQPKLIRIDAETGAATLVGSVRFVDETRPIGLVEGLAFQEASGLLFATLSETGIDQGDYHSELLVSIDPETAIATQIAQITGTASETLLGSTSDGDTLEFVGETLLLSDGLQPLDRDFLYRTDISNGSTTEIGEIGIGAVSSLAYDAARQILYGIDNIRDQLIRISLVDGHYESAVPLVLPPEVSGSVSNSTFVYPFCGTSKPSVEIGESLDARFSFTDRGALDTHTASIDWGDGQAEDALVEQAAGDGVASGSHVYQRAGTYAGQLCVVDDDGGSGCASWTVEVKDANREPIITSTPRTYAVDGLPYRYDVEAVDPEGDAPAYSLLEAPVDMMIEPGSGLIQWDAGELFEAPKVVFEDADFYEADWSQETFLADTGGVATLSYSESGGSPDAYGLLLYDVNAASASDAKALAFTFASNVNALYDPGTQGAILHIDYSHDILGPYLGGGGFALRQAGQIYVVSITGTTNSGWESKSAIGLVAEDFGRQSYLPNLDEAPEHPDFSDNGSPIELGFVFGISTAPGGSEPARTSGIDNWRVVVTPVATASVTVEASDPQGLVDTQSYVIRPERAARLQGFVYGDSDQDGAWDRTFDLIVSCATGTFRFHRNGVELNKESSQAGVDSVVGPDGLVYFTSGGVYRLDPATGAVEPFVEPGLLQYPAGLAFGSDGDLYVTDTGSNEIIRFDGATGEPVLAISVASGSYPSSVAFGADGNLYVAVARASNIQRYSPTDGRYLGVFASHSRIRNGAQIAFGPDGDLYASTENPGSVLRFSGTTGAFLEVFVPIGSGGLERAQGLAFGLDGHLYLASYDNGKILRYDGSTGAFLDVAADVGDEVSVSDVLVLPISTDPEELGLADWTVFLDDNGNGQLDAGERVSLTNAEGFYAFDPVIPGAQVVRQVTQEGWQQLAPSTGVYDISIQPGETGYQLDFGNIREGTGGNVAPRFTSTPSQAGRVGVAYVYDADAFDADGDILTFSLVTGPGGMGLEPDTGVLAWVPDPDQIGPHPVTVRVEDTSGALDEQSFTIAVEANRPPVITSAPATVAATGHDYGYQIIATDPDGDSLSYWLVSGPSDMTLSAEGLLSWPASDTRPASADIEIQVADDLGASAVQAWTVQVQDVAAPVVTVLMSTNLAQVGDTVQIQVQATSAAAIERLGASVDGAEIQLDGAGIGTFIASDVGFYDVRGSAVDIFGQGGEVTRQLLVGAPGDATSPTAALTNIGADCFETSDLYPLEGQVSDDTLVYYELRMRERGASGWIPFASGEGQDFSGQLGVFDPTVLRNGVHDIQLYALDPSGNITTLDTCAIVEGKLKVGQVNFAQVDDSLPAPGIPLAAAREYDSRAQGSGDFGPGWTLASKGVRAQAPQALGDGWSQQGGASLFDPYVLFETHQHILVISYGDGETDRFRMDVNPKTSPVVPLDYLTVSYKPEAGTEGSAVALDEDPEVILNEPHLMTYDADIYSPRRFRITRRDGTVYVLSMDKGIESITDPNGNTVTYGDNGISHSNGASISFERGAGNRIERITDSFGGVYDYFYDQDGYLERVEQVGQSQGQILRRVLSNYVYAREVFGNSLERKLETIRAPDGTELGAFEYDAYGRMTGLIDADGNRVIYGYDLPNHTQTVTDRLGHVTEYDYDSRGNVTARTDPLGNITRWEYDADDNVSAEVQPDGARTERTYSAAGDLLTETDPLGSTTSYTYDGGGRLLTRTDALGRVYTTERDANGNAIRQSGPGRDTLLMTYDADGNLLTQQGSAGIVAAFGYDGSGQVTQIRGYRESAPGELLSRSDIEYDAQGRPTRSVQYVNSGQPDEAAIITENRYDTFGNLIEEVTPAGTTQYRYDTNQRRIASADHLGRWTHFVYDDQGRLLKTILPDEVDDADGDPDAAGFAADDLADNPETASSYDAEGQVLTVTDLFGNVATYTYDALGRRTSTLYPDGTESSQGYDAVGNVTLSTDRLGGQTHYTYDLAGRQLTLANALGNVWTTEYDAVGNRSRAIDPLGRATVYEYDDAGRLVRTEYPDGSETSRTYDGRGNLLTETDQAGRTTALEYDDQDRLVAVEQLVDADTGEIARTEYRYDQQGRKVAQIDALGRTTRWTYDDFGRETSRTLPLGRTETFTYLPDGRQETHTDFNGLMIRYAYDGQGRLVGEYWLDGIDDDVLDISYAYDFAGRIVEGTKRGMTVQYEYDDVRQAISRLTYPGIGGIDYEYDALGRRTALTTTTGTVDNPRTRRVEYAFDALSRLDTVTGDHGVTDYSYDAVGNLIAESTTKGADSTTTDYGYDDLDRKTSITLRNGAGDILASYAYQLDPSGMVEHIEEHGGRVVVYAYDPMSRLISEQITQPGQPDLLFTFEYDKVGNRTRHGRPGGEVVTYAYDDNDRLLSETSTLNGIISYSYNDNGQLIGESGPEKTASYAYDPDERLVGAEITRAGDTLQAIYSYDHNDNRVGQTLTDANGLSETSFLVDPGFQFAQVLEEQDGAGGLTAAYTLGNDLIAQTRGAETSYYHHDRIGSVRQLSHIGGSVANTYVYEAYGQILDRSDAIPNSYEYAGEHAMSQLGWYYLRARNYLPGLGRFAGIDPFDGVIAQPLTLNKYGYTEGRPTGFVDPSGLWSLAELSITNRILLMLASTQATTALNLVTTSLTWKGVLEDEDGLPDALIASFAVDGGLQTLLASAGGTVLYDFRSRNAWLSSFVGAGLSPTTLFRTRRGPSYSAFAGVVYNMNEPNDLSGFGVTATWPLSVIHLLPKALVSGNAAYFGFAMQIAKKIKNATNGIDVQFALSPTTGTSSILFGNKSHSFSWQETYSTKFVPLEFHAPNISRALEPVVSRLRAVPRSIDAIARGIHELLGFHIRL